jgi:hypothetical protein
MGITEILNSLDHQIAQLQRVRALLGGSGSALARNGNGARNGARPRVAGGRAAKRKKRKLTPEGRRRIVEAVKRRWEAQKKAAAAAQN